MLIKRIILAIYLVIFPLHLFGQQNTELDYPYYRTEQGIIYLNEDERFSLDLLLDDQTRLSLHEKHKKGERQRISLEEGTYKFSLSDRGDNAIIKKVVIVDGTPPSSELSYTGAPKYEADSLIIFGRGLITDFSVSDKHSGVSELLVSVNGGNFQPRKKRAITSFPSPGNTTVSFYAVDRVGNKEQVAKRSFFLDYTPPNSQFSIKGPQYSHTLGSGARILMSGSDRGAGIGSINYNYNDSTSLKTYTNPLKINKLAEGRHILYFRAEDRVENKEEVNSYILYVDRTPPSVSLNHKGPYYVKEGIAYVSSSTEFILSAEDNQAGVQKVTYNINNTQWRSYRGPFTIEGERDMQYISYRAKDRVENKSESKFQKVFLDQEPPRSSYTLEGKYLSNDNVLIISSNTRLKLDGTDMGSGIESVFYTINGESKQQYKKPLTFDQGDSVTVKFYARDQVGNVERREIIRLTVNDKQLAGISSAARTTEKKSIKHQFKRSSNDSAVMLGAQSLPVYLYVSPSPADTATSYMLVKNEKSSFESGQRFKKEGTKRIQISIQNKVREYVMQIDGSAPETSMKFAKAVRYQENDKLFLGKNVSIQLMSNDNISGVQEIYYSTGNDPFQRYESPLKMFFREKSYLLRFYAVDSVGNQETIRDTSFTVDLSPPKTKHLIQGPHTANIFSPQTRIKLNRNDNLSGVAHTFFSFDNGDEQEYEGAIDLSDYNLKHGEHTLTYYSVDRLKHREKPVSLQFKYDNTSPTAELKLLQDSHTSNGISFISQTAQFSFEGEGPQSDLQKIEYKFDGETWKTFDGKPFDPELTEGRHTFLYRFTDHVGNQTQNIRKILFVDTQEPESSFSIRGPRYTPPSSQQEKIFLGSSSRISLSATDDNAGVEVIRYRLADQSWQNYDSPFLLSEKGRQTLEFYAVDRVGNRESSNSQLLILDHQAPEISLEVTPKPSTEATPQEITSSTLISIKAIDELTDIDQLQYSINGEQPKIYRTPLSDFRTGELTLTVIATDLVGNKREKTYRFLVKSER